MHKTAPTGCVPAFKDARQTSMDEDIGRCELYPACHLNPCPDADDAAYENRYFDQILNEQSQLLASPKVNEQPTVKWRKREVIDATGPR